MDPGPLLPGHDDRADRSEPERAGAADHGPGGFSGASRAGGKQLQPGERYSARANPDGSLSLLTASGKQLGRFAAPLTVTGPGPLSVTGLGSYRGALVLRPDGSGGVETVDALALEDYVRGVISAEMPSSWSLPALEVQAVAARTYAITTTVGGGAFDLYPDTRSQMYRGVAAETSSTDAAVAATRGQVVTYGGVPVVTYFFSSSGGHTENIENVWTGRPPRRGCAGSPIRTTALALTRIPLGFRHDPGERIGEAGGARQGQPDRHPGHQARVLASDPHRRGGRDQGAQSVTGTQLQQAFGLPTTDAAFTTVSTLRGAGIGLHGSVFPGTEGAPVAIQVSGGGRWRTILRARTAAGGAYQTVLPGPGRYRVSYRGLDGPAVNVR